MDTTLGSLRAHTHRAKLDPTSLRPSKSRKSRCQLASESPTADAKVKLAISVPRSMAQERKGTRANRMPAEIPPRPLDKPKCRSKHSWHGNRRLCHDGGIKRTENGAQAREETYGPGCAEASPFLQCFGGESAE
jgi:hypothetical protein